MLVVGKHPEKLALLDELGIETGVDLEAQSVDGMVDTLWALALQKYENKEGLIPIEILRRAGLCAKPHGGRHPCIRSFSHELYLAGRACTHGSG